MQSAHTIGTMKTATCMALSVTSGSTWSVVAAGAVASVKMEDTVPKR